MAELMLVNPRRRRRRKTTSHKRRSPRRRVRRNPIAANPRRRRRTTHRRRSVRRNPRLSVGGMKSKLMPALIGGAGAVALDYGFNFIPLPANFKTGLAGDAVKGLIAAASPMLTAKLVGRANAERAAIGALTVIAAKAIAKLMPGGSVSEYISGLGYMQAGTFIPSASSADELAFFEPTAPIAQAAQPDNMGEFISGYDNMAYASGY